MAVKTLIVFSIIQMALIVFLIVGEGQHQNAQIESQAEPDVQVYEPEPAQLHYAPVSDEQLLRQIIREELAALPGSQYPQSELRYSDTTYSADDRYLAEEVSYRIDQFKGIGQIPMADMSALQADIMKLRPADQRRLMGRLVTALNTGEIDGRIN